MTNPNHGTNSSAEYQKQQEELRRLQEQVKQQKAYLEHLKWKESASI